MPYRLSAKGERLLQFRPGSKTAATIDAAISRLDFLRLTDWQKQVLVYLEGREGFTTSHEIGLDLKIFPRAVSGIAYSLYKRGLVDKKE